MIEQPVHISQQSTAHSQQSTVNSQQSTVHSPQSIDHGEQSTANSQQSVTQGLPVMEAFYTLQGEGFHQGHAAYFIRLAGCDVGCFWCDVKESWEESAHPVKTIEQIIGEAQRSTVNSQQPTASYQPIVVITGGEPLLHNLDELTEQLQAQDFRTHIETSGSSPVSGYWDWICLSPKKFKKPLPEVLAVANELKVIVYNKSDFKWAEVNAAQVSSGCKLYLQPEWSKSSEITPLIIEYIKRNPQWQLSLQVHKYINIP
ncbi:MAG TPA: 7-carboxy-7-deazaguanine synthase QueE [Parafilimonas sp.]|nr:7-carboxy-7-deazaguanine synthase QueE [Parafilimonas sp.]